MEVNIMPVVGEGMPSKLDESRLPDALGILALRNAVIFPGTVFPVTVGREKSIRVVREAERRDGLLGAIPQNDVTVEDPQASDLMGFGTVCKVLKTLEMPDGSLTAILQAFLRFETVAVLGYEPYITATVRYLHDTLPQEETQEIHVLSDELRECAGEIIESASFVPKEAAAALASIDSFPFLVNFIATTVEVENFTERAALLRYDDVHERGLALLKVLQTQIQLLRIKQEISQKVKSDIDQQQREYYLNNQLKTIQEELGMDETEDFARFRERAAEKKWPEEVKAIFDKEMARLEKYNPSSPDYSIQYN